MDFLFHLSRSCLADLSRASRSDTDPDCGSDAVDGNKTISIRQTTVVNDRFPFIRSVLAGKRLGIGFRRSQLRSFPSFTDYLPTIFRTASPVSSLSSEFFRIASTCSVGFQSVGAQGKFFIRPKSLVKEFDALD